MTKGNVGSLLVFDPSKITMDEPVKEASGEAVVGIVTERGASLVMYSPLADTPEDISRPSALQWPA